MTEAVRQKFLVLYLVPGAVIEEWKKTDPATREPAEQAMRADWMRWTNDHADAILSTEAGGATKRVTSGGVANARNDIMLYSFVEADTHETAAKMFENHPHLRIPQSSIEVMAVRSMGGM